MIETRSNHGISLADVLPHACFLGTGRVYATSCCGDSRRVRPGDLFVAMEGEQDDGHNHVSEAISRGCQAIVAERPLPVRGVPVCLVDDSRDAFGRICQALAGSPSDGLSLIGITGTSGKTTTAALVQSILQVAGGRAGSVTSLGYDDQSVLQPPFAHEMSSPLLAQWLRRMDASHCTHAVVEASSGMLARRTLAGSLLDVACITNIHRGNRLHLHNTLENYRAIKASILRYLRPEGALIVDGQDPNCVRMLDQFQGQVLTIGIDHAADISATILDRNLGEQTFLLTVGSESVAVRTRMVGDHHVRNCLLAAGTCLTLGVDLPTIARGLGQLESLPARMQAVVCGQPFAAFVDAARTADELSAVLGWLRKVTPGRVHCVLGGDADADREMRLRIGHVASRLADSTVLSSGHCGTEPPQWIAAELLDGFSAAADVRVELHRPTAIRWALDRGEPGDSVLLAGMGDTMYYFEGEGPAALDDYAVAQEYLTEDAPAGRMLRLAA